MRKLATVLFAGAMVFLGAIVLSGCANTKVEGAAKIVAIEVMADPERAAFVMQDLAEANRSAHAHNDVIAYQCYDYLEVRLPELGVGLHTDVIGAISAFQKARNGVKIMQDGFSDEMLTACGPLFLDAQRDLSGIGGFIARLGTGVL